MAGGNDFFWWDAHAWHVHVMNCKFVDSPIGRKPISGVFGTESLVLVCTCCWEGLRQHGQMEKVQLLVE